MKTRSVRLIFTWLLACCVGAVSYAENLVILGDDAYPPVIHDAGGTPSGILVNILKRASALTGDTYVVQLSPWKRAYGMALRGDGGIIGISLNQERSRLFDFSKPIYDDDIQVITLKTRTFTFNKIEDLKGKTLGGVNGASYGEEVDKAIVNGLFLVERDIGQAGRLRKLLAGRLDAALIGNGQAGFDIAISGHPELQANRDQFAVLAHPLTRDPLHLAFAKSMGKRAALDRFDVAIEKLRKDGELKKLGADLK